MTFIDGSAVNVALPVIQRELGATAAQMQWVIESYALFLAALILVGGSLGDEYGRKRLYALGIVVFAASSIVCAAAPNVLVLIIARSVQGIGAALAMPESLALISVSFTGAARGRAIGTWSGFASIMGVAGPVIGGFLAQHASWRWVFIINIPLAVAVLAILALCVPESRDEDRTATIDWLGAALATCGLGALVYGLIRIPFPDGRVDGGALIVAGVVVLGGFVYCQRHIAHPMMPLSLFKSRTFTVVNVYTLALYMALGGSLYFFPFLLIDVQGYTPTAAGAAFIPFVVLQFAFSRWSGGLAGRIGTRTPLVVGATIAGCAFIAYALPGIGGSYWTTYFPAIVLLGIGGVFFIAPLTTAVFDSSDSALSGIASAMNNAVARTAGLVAIALFGIVFAGVFAGGFDARLGRAHVAPATRALANAERAKFTAGTVPADVPESDRVAVGLAVRTGYLAGFRAVMFTSAGVCFLAALIAFVTIPSPSRR